MGLGCDVFAIVGAGVGGSRGNQRDRAECGHEANTRRSHQRVTFLQLSVVHLETIENDSQYWIIFWKLFPFTCVFIMKPVIIYPFLRVIKYMGAHFWVVG